MCMYICTVYIHGTRFKHTGYTGFIFQKFQIQVIGQIWPNLMISHDFTPSIATLAEKFACACSNLDSRKKNVPQWNKRMGTFHPSYWTCSSILHQQEPTSFAPARHLIPATASEVGTQSWLIFGQLPNGGLGGDGRKGKLQKISEPIQKIQVDWEVFFKHCSSWIWRFEHAWLFDISTSSVNCYMCWAFHYTHLTASWSVKFRHFPNG